MNQGKSENGDGAYLRNSKHKAAEINDHGEVLKSTHLPHTQEMPMSEILWELTKRWVSCTLSLTIENSLFFVNMMFVRQLNDPNAIAGCGLGNMIFVMFMFSINIGVNGGVDTLVSQAYGRKNYELCNTYFNVSRIVAVICFIPQAYIAINADRIFRFMGQPPESSEMAYRYMIISLPGCLIYGLFESTRRYLQAHGIYNPILIMWSWSVVVHIAANYILVNVLDYGLEGVAIGTCLCYASNYIFSTIYITIYDDCIPSSFAFSIPPNLFKKTWEYLKYGIPSCIILLLEWWTYEILTIYSGWLDVNSQATNTIMINLEDIFSDISQAIGFASATLVGETLGANLPHSARRAAQATLTIGMGLCTTFWIIILLFKHEIFHFYSENDELVGNYLLVVPFFLAQLMFEIIHHSLLGVIAGMGYQATTTIFDVIAYWGIMIPSSFLLAFTFGYGYQGIWMGVPLGTFTGAVVYSIIVYRTNWEKLALESSQQWDDDSKDN
jgi:multidrug resistance protein, MATE family